MMSTYTELFGLKNESNVINKVVVACVVAANGIKDELDTVDNHANRLLWAAGVFENPQHEAERMYWALLAANKDNTVEQITGALDSAIQTQVDDHIDLFATG